MPVSPDQLHSFTHPSTFMYGPSSSNGPDYSTGHIDIYANIPKFTSSYATSNSQPAKEPKEEYDPALRHPVHFPAMGYVMAREGQVEGDGDVDASKMHPAAFGYCVRKEEGGRVTNGVADVVQTNGELTKGADTTEARL